MRRTLIVTIVLALAAAGATTAQNLKPYGYPYVLLDNGQVQTTVLIPDKDKGFYRSTRFDWSGMVWQLTYKGHTYFNEIRSFTPHNPLENEHGMSLAEEFGIGTSKSIPPRFTEAQPGETFLKIGVGLLEKIPGSDRYQFSGKYPLVEPGVWSVNSDATWVEFQHRVHDKYGYGYTYTKRMELLAGEPTLVVSHTLVNTGTQRIKIDQYCHNFFDIDSTPIGPDYRIDFAFTPKNLNQMNGTEHRGNSLVFTKNVEGSLFTIYEGFGNTPGDGRIVLRNTKTGAAVEMSGDFPLSGFNFWTNGQVISPELFVFIDIAPGESFSWKRTYTFIAE
jgi:hypothetical protein